MPAPYRRLGRIVKTHGTRGEVSLALRGGLSPTHLEGLEVWIVPPPESGAVAHAITEVRSGPKGPLVRISGIESPADAHDVVGRYLLTRGDEQSAEEDVEALLGFEVHDATRGYVGTVSDVIHTGANDVLVLTDGPYGEVLVPVIPDVMRDTDAQDRVLHVVLLEGLIGLEES